MGWDVRAKMLFVCFTDFITDDLGLECVHLSIRGCITFIDQREKREILELLEYPKKRVEITHQGRKRMS